MMFWKASRITKSDFFQVQQMLNDYSTEANHWYFNDSPIFYTPYFLLSLADVQKKYTFYEIYQTYGGAPQNYIIVSKWVNK